MAAQHKVWLEELGKVNFTPVSAREACTDVLQAVAHLPPSYAYALGSLLLTQAHRKTLLQLFRALTDAAMAKSMEPFQPHLLYRFAQMLWKGSASIEEEEEKTYDAFARVGSSLCLSPHQAGEPKLCLSKYDGCASKAFPEFSPQPGFAPFNPSITAHPTTPDRFAVIMRTGNYTYSYERHKWEYPNNHIETVNYLMTLQGSTATLQSGHKKISTATPMPFPFWIAGLEDCRIFYWPRRRSFYASCTTLEASANNLQRIALFRLPSEEKQEEIKCENFTVLRGWGDAHRQKNWLPLIDPADGHLYFIYSFCPYTLLKYREEDGTVVPHRIQVPETPNAWRGSSSPVTTGYDAVPYVCMVHESDFPRYAHRFVGMDRTFRVTHVSDRVCFQDYRIEFSCGMAADIPNQRFLIPYGRHDREAHLLTVPYSVVFRELLRPCHF